MSYKIKGNAITIDSHCKANKFTEFILPIYENFNKQWFDLSVNGIPQEFNKFIHIVYSKFCQQCVINNEKSLDIFKLNESNDVILAFSGGMDSVYQALVLKEMGYNVHLFHINGLNTYAGGQSTKVARAFSEKAGFDYIEIKFHKDTNNDNPYKQSWSENPIKNQTIISIMLDYCIENGWNKISLGDDMCQTLSESTVGVNVTDSIEVTKSFVDAISRYAVGIEFIPIKREYGSVAANKFERLKKIDEYDLLDYFYSCVCAGRFNKYNHDKAQDKYGIKLAEHDCGYHCDKCAINNLLLHYYGGKEYPNEFIEKCWLRIKNKKIGYHSYARIGEDIFGDSVPIEVKIKNLLYL